MPKATFLTKKKRKSGSFEVTFFVSCNYNGGITQDGDWYPGFEVPPPDVPEGFKLVSLGVGLQLNSRPPYCTMLLEPIDKK